MKKSRFVFVAIAAMALIAPQAGAQCDTYALTGTQSFDELGDISNTIVNRDYSVTGCLSVTDIGWTDVSFTTVGGSWGSEVQVQASASDLSSPQTIQFNGIDSPGSYGPSSGNLGAGVTLLGDMMLRLEFFESFQDSEDTADADYTNGTLDITPVELLSLSVE